MSGKRPQNGSPFMKPDIADCLIGCRKVLHCILEPGTEEACYYNKCRVHKIKGCDKGNIVVLTGKQR